MEELNICTLFILSNQPTTQPGGGISSVVARGLVILWVTGSIPEVGESFRRRLKDSLIDWESAMGNS